MEGLKKLTKKAKMEVNVNRLKFYGERERLSCTKRQNKKHIFWLRKKSSSNIKGNQVTIEVNTYQKSVLNLGP